MRRSLARFSALESSVHAPSWADFITATPELKFSVHTKGSKAGTYIVRRPLSCSKEHPMADTKNPNEKQPGEKPEGKQHYNPGNQSGKEAEIVPKKDAKKDE